MPFHGYYKVDEDYRDVIPGVGITGGGLQRGKMMADQLKIFRIFRNHLLRIIIFQGNALGMRLVNIAQMAFQLVDDFIVLIQRDIHFTAYFHKEAGQRHVQLYVLGVFYGRPAVKTAIIQLGGQILDLSLAHGQVITTAQHLQDISGKLVNKKILKGFFLQRAFPDAGASFQTDGNDGEHEQQLFETRIGYIQLILLFHIQKELFEERKIVFQIPLII